MSKLSRYATLSALLLAAVARSDAPAKPPSTEDGQVVHLADAKWMPAKAKEFPPGAMGAPIAVDPTTGGALSYAKFPPGASVPAHWHSFTEYTVVLTGKATFTVDGKASELSSGDFIVIPAKVHHKLTCGTAGECVLFTRRAGPTDYNWDM